jgi:hypothetical protein
MRIEGDHFRADVADLVARDRTDPAQILGDDHVGPKQGDPVGIERVERFAVLDRGLHCLVDLPTAEAGQGHLRPTHHRQPGDREGPVTLFGPPDQRGKQA